MDDSIWMFRQTDLMAMPSEPMLFMTMRFIPSMLTIISIIAKAAGDPMERISDVRTVPLPNPRRESLRKCVARTAAPAM